MNTKATVLTMLAEAGEQPRDIAQSLERFREAASILSRNHPRLIDQYPDKWVAVFGSKVVAYGNSIESVIKQVRKLGIPDSDIIVRFIEKKRRTLIL